MSRLNRLRLWWYRKRMHLDCAQWQLRIWKEGPLSAPMGACTKCYPRMVWIRDTLTAKATVVGGRQ